MRCRFSPVPLVKHGLAWGAVPHICDETRIYAATRSDTGSLHSVARLGMGPDVKGAGSARTGSDVKPDKHL